MFQLDLSSFSVFQKRVLSSSVMVIALALIVWGGPLPLKILFFFFAGALAVEWVKICGLSLKFTSALMIGLLYTSMYAVSIGRSFLGFGILMCCASFGIFLSWFSWYRRFLWIALGLLYIGVPLLSALWILESIPFGIQILVWIVMLVAINDIAAYGIGTWLQGPKLLKSVSPSKTWSGFLGGVGCATLAGGIFYFFIECGLSLHQFMELCLFLAVWATLGDLFESKIKRVHNVKDSGALIPGHGGIFDRLDGFLFVLPMISLAIRLWPQNVLFFLK